MSKLEVSIYKGAAANGIRLSREDANAIAYHLTCGYIVIPKSDLPEVFESNSGNGICTALAQEKYQPELYLHPADGDVPGEWSLRIAYANLAIAAAVKERDAAVNKRRDELARLFSGLATADFAGQPASTQLAILKVIELESAA